MDNKQVKKLKKDFPIFTNNKGLVYLDSAATSQKPKSVIKTLANFYEKDNANISRGFYALAQSSMKKFDNVRKEIANFIGAEKDEIVFTKNTTEALNLLAYTILPIIPKNKDEIVITEMEHHSNLIPWQQLARRKKMKLKIIKLKQDYTLNLEDAKEKITDRTTIVAFTHVSNILGTINPIKEIVQLAKVKKAYSIIDAAQSIPHLKINVKDLGCDFLAFSSHKMLGPNGIGVLYGRESLLLQLPPFMFGGGMIKKVEFGKTEFSEPPEKFEAGTQNIAEAVALEEAIKYIKKIGLKNIGAWEKQLLFTAIDELQYMKEIEIYNPGIEKSIGILSFNIKGVHPHDVAELLNQDGIAVRAGHSCAMPLMEALGTKGGVCRASFYFYNTLEDVERLIKGIKKIVRKFR